MPQHEVTDAGRRPAEYRLDVVAEAVVAVGGVHLRHRQKVLIEVLHGAQADAAHLRDDLLLFQRSGQRSGTFGAPDEA